MKVGDALRNARLRQILSQEGFGGRGPRIS